MSHLPTDLSKYKYRLPTPKYNKVGRYSVTSYLILSTLNSLMYVSLNCENSHDTYLNDITSMLLTNQRKDNTQCKVTSIPYVVHLVGSREL